MTSPLHVCEICGSPARISVTHAGIVPIDHHFCETHEPQELTECRSKGYKFSPKGRSADLLRKTMKRLEELRHSLDAE